MTTINLYQSSEEKDSASKKAQYINSGFIVSIGVLGIVLIALGGTKFYANELVKRDTQLTQRIEQEKLTGLTGNMVDRAADFQQRLDFIKANSSKDSSYSILQNVAKTVTPGVTIDSFKFEKQTISLVMRGDNFVSLARQILAFKQSRDFSGVTTGNVRRSEDKIIFDVTLNVVGSVEGKSNNAIK